MFNTSFRMQIVPSWGRRPHVEIILLPLKIPPETFIVSTFVITVHL